MISCTRISKFVPSRASNYLYNAWKCTPNHTLRCQSFRSRSFFTGRPYQQDLKGSNPGIEFLESYKQSREFILRDPDRATKNHRMILIFSSQFSGCYQGYQGFSQDPDIRKRRRGSRSWLPWSTQRGFEESIFRSHVQQRFQSQRSNRFFGKQRT